MLWRGRDPAQALADALAREWGHASTALLGRAGGGGRQRGLDALERQTNVVGAFRASKAVPATVCLIDDVYTTGATASAAAAALRAGGACRVEVVTFARAVRRHTSTVRVRDRKMPKLR